MGGHRLVVLFVVAGSLVGCPASGESEVGDRRNERPEGRTNFVVASGPDGVAVIEGPNIVPLAGLNDPGFLIRGAMAVPVDGSTAAVLLDGRLAVVSRNGIEASADCRECSGLAASDAKIVTTRRNQQPGNGFDILTFTPALEVEVTVPARRLEERVTIDYVPENVESPVTLAASPERVTVGYLSLNGGVRRGPSIVAQYSHDGELLDSVVLDGILGAAAVSPDGQMLALGVGGSGGACITSSELVVLRLNDLETLDSGPPVPAPVSASTGGLDEPWLLLTDLLWNGAVLHAVGEAFTTGNLRTGDCEIPETWGRTFDTESGEVTDVPLENLRATRWLGPGCDDTLDVVGQYYDTVATTHIDGQEQVLGSYSTLALGQAQPARCR